MGEDGDERAGWMSAFHNLEHSPPGVARCHSYLMPTPPAIKTTFLILWVSIPVGGQTKLPPTRMLSSLPRISSFGFQSHAADGFAGESWTASSTYGARPCDVADGSAFSPSSGSVWGSGNGSNCASAGVEVMVNPPA